jgi:predicted transcriptional regulator
MKTKTKSVRVDSEQLYQLQTVKKRTGMSLSWMLASSIDEWLSHHYKEVLRKTRKELSKIAEGLYESNQP